MAAWILTCAFLVTLGLFLGTSQLVARWSADYLGHPQDELEWLRREFQLSPSQLEQIRRLHEGYLPVCRAWCTQIGAARDALEAELAEQGRFTVRAAELVRELARLRAECQTAMLQHFDEVSRAMPPEQGRRYFAEMLRLTLTAHGQTERAMNPHDGHGHRQP
ncbi:MAG: periplasmic heavy metal sensor [Verrucomicrobiota bacterium]|nr:periplasmic heavy metal sensor [Limisphaera sp.]MDW8381720.1 periplasmic heavy metal sensor [Verrucomicrobiota bacterium]